MSITLLSSPLQGLQTLDFGMLFINILEGLIRSTLPTFD